MLWLSAQTFNLKRREQNWSRIFCSAIGFVIIGAHIQAISPATVNTLIKKYLAYILMDTLTLICSWSHWRFDRMCLAGWWHTYHLTWLVPVQQKLLLLVFSPLKDKCYNRKKHSSHLPWLTASVIKIQLQTWCRLQQHYFGMVHDKNTPYPIIHL